MKQKAWIIAAIAALTLSTSDTASALCIPGPSASQQREYDRCVDIEAARQRSQMDATMDAAEAARRSSEANGGLLGFLDKLGRMQRDAEDAETLTKMAHDVPRMDKLNRDVACNDMLAMGLQRRILSVETINAFIANCRGAFRP